MSENRARTGGPSAKARLVLARLEHGTASKTELRAISANVGARIWELRKAGHVIPRPVDGTYRLERKESTR